MDVGITNSTKERTLHFITGTLVVAAGYSAVMFAIRMLVMG
jgi:hypothetical protein